MFTGIIQHRGTVQGWENHRLFVKMPIPRPKKGDSIALDGVCLTVVSWARGGVAGFDVSEETRRLTTMTEWASGRKVNVETALKAGDAMGGHLVQGHVEGVGHLFSKTPQESGVIYRFQGFTGIHRLLAPKGSVTVDGVSLTVATKEHDVFTVAVIPHTEETTTLGLKELGEPVNLETDLIARQVAAYFDQQ